MQICFQISLIVIFYLDIVSSVSLEKDLSITWGQKQALDKVLHEHYYFFECLITEN